MSRPVEDVGRVGLAKGPHRASRERWCVHSRGHRFRRRGPSTGTFTRGRRLSAGSYRSTPRRPRVRRAMTACMKTRSPQQKPTVPYLFRRPVATAVLRDSRQLTMERRRPEGRGWPRSRLPACGWSAPGAGATLPVSRSGAIAMKPSRRLIGHAAHPRRESVISWTRARTGALCSARDRQPMPARYPRDLCAPWPTHHAEESAPVGWRRRPCRQYGGVTCGCAGRAGRRPRISRRMARVHIAFGHRSRARGPQRRARRPHQHETETN